MIKKSASDKFLLIATFKSNKAKLEVENWLKEVEPAAAKSSASVIVAPSFPHLVPAQSVLGSSSSLTLCAQDVSPFPPGSYTGAVSAIQLKDLGIEYCLIGHSERRSHFHETHIDVAAKARELQSVGITPVICLARGDINPQLAALDDKEIKSSLFVYEPPADIGGSETAPLEDIKATCELINSLTSSPVLYGGSVNPGNLSGLLDLDLAGVLVSRASLNSNTFVDLINRYEAHQK